jgi:hypothetical protein
MHTKGRYLAAEIRRKNNQIFHVDISQRLFSDEGGHGLLLREDLLFKNLTMSTTTPGNVHGPTKTSTFCGPVFTVHGDRRFIAKEVN